MKENVLKFEEKDQYIITVNKALNRITFDFCGDLQKAKDCPDYVNHTKQAIEVVSDGYTILSVASSKKSPGFSMTTPLKESMSLLKSKEIKKTAVVIGRGQILQQMVLNVVKKLAGMNVEVFGNVTDAENWLAV